MTTARRSKQSSSSAPILTAAQYKTCQKLAAAEDLQGKRARALCLLQDGKTQAEAAAESGLTRGQVTYCLARFRRDGMAMFEVNSELEKAPAEKLGENPVKRYKKIKKKKREDQKKKRKKDKKKEDDKKKKNKKKNKDKTKKRKNKKKKK